MGAPHGRGQARARAVAQERALPRHAQPGLAGAPHGPGEPGQALALERGPWPHGRGLLPPRGRGALLPDARAGLPGALHGRLEPAQLEGQGGGRDGDGDLAGGQEARPELGGAFHGRGEPGQLEGQGARRRGLGRDQRRGAEKRGRWRRGGGGALALALHLPPPAALRVHRVPDAGLTAEATSAPQHRRAETGRGREGRGLGGCRTEAGAGGGRDGRLQLQERGARRVFQRLRSHDRCLRQLRSHVRSVFEMHPGSTSATSASSGTVT